MTTMTEYEHLMLELVNRGRLDPLGEAARYGISLNQGVASKRAYQLRSQATALFEQSAAQCRPRS